VSQPGGTHLCVDERQGSTNGVVKSSSFVESCVGEVVVVSEVDATAFYLHKQRNLLMDFVY
jgi:hypothetical protein